MSSSLKAQCEHIEADFAHSDRFGQIEFQYGQVFARTARAQNASAVAAVVFASGQTELEAALQTRLVHSPGRLCRQKVQQPVQQVLCGHRVIEDVDAVVVARAQHSTAFDQSATQVPVAVHICCQSIRRIFNECLQFTNKKEWE